MTEESNRNIILSFPGLEDAPESFVNKIMSDRSLNGADRYKSNDKIVNLCAADLYAFMANNSDFSESKLSVKYSRETFIRTAKNLYCENGEIHKVKALNIKAIGKAKTTH